MPTVLNVVGDALFVVTTKGRSEKLWLGFFMSLFGLIFIGLLGLILSSIWRFEFAVGDGHVTYRTWAGLGLVPVTRLTFPNAKAVRPIFDGPSQRPMVEIESDSGKQQFELPQRWKHNHYDHAWHVNQLVSQSKTGVHGDAMDAGSYAMLLFPSVFGITAAVFAAMGFKTDRLIADRRSRTLTCEHELFGVNWKRVAPWSEVRDVHSKHIVKTVRGTQLDYYLLNVKFKDGRTWKIALDSATVRDAKDRAARVREYVLGR